MFKKNQLIIYFRFYNENEVLVDVITVYESLGVYILNQGF